MVDVLGAATCNLYAGFVTPIPNAPIVVASPADNVATATLARPNVVAFTVVASTVVAFKVLDALID